MKILHVISGLDRKFGGPSESVPGLCIALSQRQCDITIASLDGDLSDAANSCKNYDIDMHLYTFSGPGGFSRKMNAELPMLVRNSDIVHTHGLWKFPTWRAAALCRRYSIPYVLSSRGMLQEWCLRRSSVKKRIVSSLFENASISGAACIHTTSDSETTSNLAYGIQVPMAQIPNGVNFLPTALESENSPFMGTLAEGKRVALFVGRVHPVKGLDMLMEAWNSLAYRFPDWVLIIVGPDDSGYWNVLQEKYHIPDSVLYLGAQYGIRKNALMQAAELFILPSYSENYGMSIAESLAAGTPVITTQGTPWAEILNQSCGWWVPTTTEDIKNAIQDALERSREDLAEMGNLGRKWVLVEFSWDSIAYKMMETYKWIIDGGCLPHWMRLPETF